MSEQKWEYLQKYDFQYGPRVHLNELAKMGWELISVEPCVPHPVAEHEVPPRYTFRRPLT